MDKIGIQRLNNFLTGDLVKTITRQYKNFEILSESDLQYAVTFALRSFLNTNLKSKRLTVHTCYSFSNPRIHPDVMIMKHKKPWVAIELKEKRILHENVALRERNKLRDLRNRLQEARGVRLAKSYFIYVANKGKHRVLSDKRENSWFREIPITLEKSAKLSDEEIQTFRRDFKEAAKYDC